MAKTELFEVPVLGPAIAAVGAYPVDRSRGDVAAIKRSLEVLRTGALFGIFPEGTRNPSGRSGRSRGVALLASLSGAPVRARLHRGQRAGPALAQITVAFGEPMRFRRAGKQPARTWRSLRTRS